MKTLPVIILFLLAPLFAWAGPYPVITSMRVEYFDGGAYYYITQDMVEIGSASDWVVPTDYWVAITHKHTDDGIHYEPHSAGGETISSNGKKTIGQLAQMAYDPSIGVVTHVGQNGFDECVAYVAQPNSSRDWETTIRPGGCLKVPPADEWCKITTPEILLDHGTMTLKTAEGSTAEASMGLSCTAAASVTFNLVTEDKYIYLDEGKAEISVDNKPLNSKVDLRQGSSQVTIKDVLTGVTSEGQHTGSSVLVMMPY